MSATETEEEAPPPKKSIFACLTNLPGVCVPQKSDDPGAQEPTPKSNNSPTSVASKFAAERYVQPCGSFWPAWPGA